MMLLQTFILFVAMATPQAITKGSATMFDEETILLDWHQEGVVSNPKDNPFVPVFDGLVPTEGDVNRVFRYTGLLYSAGPFRAQLEVWAGGFSGVRKGRINVTSSFPNGAAIPIEGAFFLDRDDPRRVILRIRSYDVGAEAEAAFFHVAAARVDGTPSVVVQGDTVEHTIAAESSEVVAESELDVPEGTPGVARKVRVVASVEIRPLGTGTTVVEILGDGHVLKSVPLPTGYDLPSGPVLGLAPMVLDIVTPGVRSWQLRVVTATGCTVRREFLAAALWE